MTNVSAFQLHGQNYSKAKVVGTATVTIDGATTSRPFVLELTDGNRINSNTLDSYTLRIYESGANPDTADAQYHVSKNIPRSNITIQ
jgi:hypothetical protein